MPIVGPNSANTSAIRGSGTHSPVASEGVPAAGFGNGRLGPGAIVVNVADGDDDLYENTGTEAATVWTRIDSLPV